MKNPVVWKMVRRNSDGDKKFLYAILDRDLDVDEAISKFDNAFVVLAFSHPYYDLPRIVYENIDDLPKAHKNKRVQTRKRRWMSLDGDLETVEVGGGVVGGVGNIGASLTLGHNGNVRYNYYPIPTEIPRYEYSAQAGGWTVFRT